MEDIGDGNFPNLNQNSVNTSYCISLKMHNFKDFLALKHKPVVNSTTF